MSALIFAEAFAAAAVLISSASVWYVFIKTQSVPAPKTPEVAPFVELVRGRNLGPRTDVEEQPTFLSVEERREQIASRATAPDFLEMAASLRKSHHENSGLIPPDPSAQSDHAVWRARQRGNR